MLATFAPVDSGRHPASRAEPKAGPTQVQVDVQAMLRGMERAGLMAKSGYQNNPPPPDAPDDGAPEPNHTAPDAILPN
jgi:hypothetical protein